jgi:protocatechuate 3,4-dioxygenase beta subunit
MSDKDTSHLTRRTFLRLSLAVPAPLALAAYGAGPLAQTLDGTLRGLDASSARAETLAPTPACDDGDAVTPAETEGPYYKRNTPERTSLLEPGTGGTRLLLSGRVLTRGCQPVAAALLDFWQADAAGAYDNAGYRFRGHQFTDAAGRYSLETVVPGLYPGRTRHIHVKVQAPNGPVLTTQLYFPGEARNATDRIFHNALLMAIDSTADGQVGAFEFVLNVA